MKYLCKIMLKIYGFFIYYYIVKNDDGVFYSFNQFLASLLNVILKKYIHHPTLHLTNFQPKSYSLAITFTNSWCLDMPPDFLFCLLLAPSTNYYLKVLIPYFTYSFLMKWRFIRRSHSRSRDPVQAPIEVIKIMEFIGTTFWGGMKYIQKILLHFWNILQPSCSLVRLGLNSKTLRASVTP